jgi:hypothetical protein
MTELTDQTVRINDSSLAGENACYVVTRQPRTRA